MESMEWPELLQLLREQPVFKEKVWQEILQDCAEYVERDSAIAATDGLAARILIYMARSCEEEWKEEWKDLPAEL